MDRSFKYDAFISYAVEDKVDFVHALVRALEDRGLRIYYSSDNFKLGDDINQEINAAIINSRFGIPVFSENYFESRWTKLELAGFVARYTCGMMEILPIWHGLSHDRVTETYPTISGIWSVESKPGIEKVADKISKAILSSEKITENISTTLPSSLNKKGKKTPWKKPLIIFSVALTATVGSVFVFPESKELNTPQTLLSIPDSSGYYFKKGELSFNSKNYGEAIAFYTTALRINKRPEYLVKRGQCYLLSNNTQNAVGDFGEAIKNNPNHEHAYFERAKCYIGLNEIAHAVNDLREAIRLRHPQADSLYNIINPLIRKKVGTVSICCDGTQSEKTGRGACSHHGGVCDEKNIYKMYRKY